jgi:putative transposase
MAYLFALIDWYSRFIVGWQLANSMSADHGLAALESGLTFGKPDICNADQGSQFTGGSGVETLQDLGIQVSHDGVGRCIDNVRIERFWRTIKYEDLYLRQYQDLVEARVGIGKFIVHYNYHRPHQAIKNSAASDRVFRREIVAYTCFLPYPSHLVDS